MLRGLKRGISIDADSGPLRYVLRWYGGICHHQPFTFSDLLWPYYVLDILCRQQIKLFQVVSTSEFHEYWWNNLENIFLVPGAFWGASEARTQNRPLLFYWLSLKKIRSVFLINKTRVIIISKKILEIEIFWGHEVLKLHF